MSISTVVLFLHVSGAIGYFAGIAHCLIENLPLQLVLTLLFKEWKSSPSSLGWLFLLLLPLRYAPFVTRREAEVR